MPVVFTTELTSDEDQGLFEFDIACSKAAGLLAGCTSRVNNGNQNRRTQAQAELPQYQADKLTADTNYLIAMRNVLITRVPPLVLSDSATVNRVGRTITVTE